MPVFRLTDDLVFPPPFLAEPDGLLAVGGDLSVERLLLAYRSGIFPWYEDGEPLLWWSPDPRLVLLPEELHVSRSLARTLRRGTFRIAYDTDFAQVIRKCADARGPGRDGTWITRAMIAAYNRLHRGGYAHCAEAWQGDVLAGGLYGVAIGGCFFGESMFSEAPDASKAAFAALVERLRESGFRLIDCQVHTPHLVRFGAREIPRRAFLERLAEAVRVKAGNPWAGATRACSAMPRAPGVLR